MSNVYVNDDRKKYFFNEPMNDYGFDSQHKFVLYQKNYMSHGTGNILVTTKKYLLVPISLMSLNISEFLLQKKIKQSICLNSFLILRT